MIDVEEALRVKDNFAKYNRVKSILIKGDYKKKSKISICIPTYKRVNTLRETIDSCLNQVDFDDYLIIVSDNNPERNDETEMYMSTLLSDKILYYKHEKNIGMYGNINRLYQLSKSEYTVCVHDDDLLLPNFLFVVSSILKKKNNIDILYPKSYIWDPTKGDRPEETEISIVQIYKNTSFECILTNPHPPTGFVARTNIMIATGGFDLTTYPSNDYYFCVMAIRDLNVYTLNVPLYIYRWEMNASMRIDTIKSFVEVDIPLKDYLIAKHSVLKFFRWHILKIYSESKIINIEKKYPGYDYSQIPGLITNSNFIRRIITNWFSFFYIHCVQFKHLLSLRIIKIDKKH